MHDDKRNIGYYNSEGRDALFKNPNLRELFSDNQLDVLFKNDEMQKGQNNTPVVYLRMPRHGYGFLITELDRDDPDYAFGLSNFDTKLSIGVINLNIIEKNGLAAKDPLISIYEFTGKYPLAVYAQVAYDIGTLVIDDTETAYANRFLKYNQGKNADPKQDIRLLKPRLNWLE